jgi:hypothetical protein
MEEAERLASAARLREAAMQAVREENKRLAREAARDRCDQCREPKSQRDETMSLPNGVRLSVRVAHCQSPGPDCTARVCSRLVSVPTDVANRVVGWLATEPDLAATGIGWMACLAPGTDRLILTYRVSGSRRVAATVGALSVEAFGQQSRAEPCDAPDPART